MSEVMNAPSTSALLNKRFEEEEKLQARKPVGRPKKDTQVIATNDVTESTLWREAMLVVMRNLEVRHPAQLVTADLVASDYVKFFKEKFK